MQVKANASYAVLNCYYRNREDDDEDVEEAIQKRRGRRKKKKKSGKIAKKEQEVIEEVKEVKPPEDYEQTGKKMYSFLLVQCDCYGDANRFSLGRNKTSGARCCCQ